MMQKKKRIQLNRILLCAFICVWISVSFSTTVYAGNYNSWTEGSSDEKNLHDSGTGSELFDENNSFGTDELIDQMTKDDSNYFEVQICKLINSLSYGIAAVERASRMQIDTIVLGRVAKNASVNSFGFDLSDGNLYGSLGSIVYAALRNFMFGVFGIYFLYMMLAYLIKGTGTSRANLKDALYNFLFVYALLYAVPIAVDYLLLFRDGLLKVFTEKALSSAEDFSFVDAVLQQAADETRMLYSLLALCFVCGSVWIGFNYIKIALQQAYLFGIFPLVAFRSFSDKNILNKWFSYFFANALVPLFDCIGFVMLIYELRLNPSSSLAGQFMALVIFFSIIPSRNLLIQLFGGPVPGRGFSIIPMALMAARLLGRGRGGATPSGGTNGTGNGNGGNASSGNGGNGSGTSGTGGSGSGGSNNDGSIDNPNGTTNSNGGGRNGTEVQQDPTDGTNNIEETKIEEGPGGNSEEDRDGDKDEELEIPFSEKDMIDPYDNDGNLKGTNSDEPIGDVSYKSEEQDVPEVAEGMRYDVQDTTESKADTLKGESPETGTGIINHENVEDGDIDAENPVDKEMITYEPGTGFSNTNEGNTNKGITDEGIKNEGNTDDLTPGNGDTIFNLDKDAYMPQKKLTYPGTAPNPESPSDLPLEKGDTVKQNAAGTGGTTTTGGAEEIRNENTPVQSTGAINNPNQQAVEDAAQTSTAVSNEVANKYEQHSNDPSASMGVRIARNTAKGVSVAGAVTGATLGFAATAISGNASTIMSGAVAGGMVGSVPGAIAGAGINRYAQATEGNMAGNGVSNSSSDNKNTVQRNSGQQAGTPQTQEKQLTEEEARKGCNDIQQQKLNETIKYQVVKDLEYSLGPKGKQTLKVEGQEFSFKNLYFDRKGNENTGRFQDTATGKWYYSEKVKEIKPVFYAKKGDGFGGVSENAQAFYNYRGNRYDEQELKFGETDDGKRNGYVFLPNGEQIYDRNEYGKKQ